MIVKLHDCEFQSSQRFVSSSSVRSFQAMTGCYFTVIHSVRHHNAYHMCLVILGVDTCSGRVPRRRDRCGDTCVLCGPSDSALYSTVTIVTRQKNLKSEMNEAGLV